MVKTQRKLVRTSVDSPAKESLSLEKSRCNRQARPLLSGAVYSMPCQADGVQHGHRRRHHQQLAESAMRYDKPRVSLGGVMGVRYKDREHGAVGVDIF